MDDSQVLNLSKNSSNFYANQSFNDSLLNDSTSSLNLSQQQAVAAAAALFTQQQQQHAAALAAAAAALLQRPNMHQDLASLANSATFAQPPPMVMKPNQTRYQQLLSVIEEMGKDIRTTYMSNKNSTERLKRSIASARILVKDCLLECERNTKS